MSFKLGHVSIPKRRIFLPLFLFCAYDVSVLQNFKIFTHLLPIYSYKDPRLMEVTYHCINVKDRVRKVPYFNFWNFSDPILEVIASTKPLHYQDSFSASQRQHMCTGVKYPRLNCWGSWSSKGPKDAECRPTVVLTCPGSHQPCPSYGFNTVFCKIY